MSPQIATLSPSIRPSRRRMVSASSRAWVGCSPRAVAGIDHRAVHDRGDVGGGALGLVADDEDVGPHRVQRQRGVDQALALAHAGGGRMEVGDLRAEPFAGDLEGEERARAVLEEGVDLGEAGEPVVGLARAAVERDPGLGRRSRIGAKPRSESVRRRQGRLRSRRAGCAMAGRIARRPCKIALERQAGETGRLQGARAAVPRQRRTEADRSSASIAPWRM